MKHKEETQSFPARAEDVLSTNVPTITQSAKIRDVLRSFRTKKDAFEHMTYAYVLDKKSRLVGTVSMRDLLTTDKKTVKSIMKKKPVSQYLGTSMNMIARTAIRHKIKAVPIVNKRNIFQGVVSSNAILTYMEQAHVSETLRRSGIEAKEGVSNMQDMSYVRAAKIRSPWLLLGLLGEFGAASILGVFESQLSASIEIAFFIPLVLYMGAALGIQAETLYIRSLALGKIQVGRYLSREFINDAMIGLLCGGMAFLLVFLWLQNILVAGAVGSAIFLNMLVSGQLAVFISWQLSKRHQDPALGAGPFANVIQDIISILIYLGVVSIFFFVA